MREEQQCAFPGCEEIIQQPECGGERKLYCTPDHRTAARRLRSMARSAAEPVAAAPAPRGGSTWLTDPFSLPGF